MEVLAILSNVRHFSQLWTKDAMSTMLEESLDDATFHKESSILVREADSLFTALLGEFYQF